MIKHIANIITGCRILGSVMLLFFPAFSPEFYITYILCGFSDMIDGTIARKTNSTSELGDKIDTAADLAFLLASLVKLLPKLPTPHWVWIWGVGIAIIKIRTIVLKKQFIALHTVMNKITGLALFLLPLTRSFVDLNVSFITVCSMATFAAIQETCLVKRTEEKINECTID